MTQFPSGLPTGPQICFPDPNGPGQICFPIGGPILTGPTDFPDIPDWSVSRGRAGVLRDARQCHGSRDRKVEVVLERTRRTATEWLVLSENGVEKLRVGGRSERGSGGGTCGGPVSVIAKAEGFDFSLRAERVGCSQALLTQSVNGEEREAKFDPNDPDCADRLKGIGICHAAPEEVERMFEVLAPIAKAHGEFRVTVLRREMADILAKLGSDDPGNAAASWGCMFAKAGCGFTIGALGAGCCAAAVSGGVTAPGCVVCGGLAGAGGALCGEIC